MSVMVRPRSISDDRLLPCRPTPSQPRPRRLAFALFLRSEAAKDPSSHERAVILSVAKDLAAGFQELTISPFESTLGLRPLPS
jgi:hypothetical protein